MIKKDCCNGTAGLVRMLKLLEETAIEKIKYNSE